MADWGPIQLISSVSQPSWSTATNLPDPQRSQEDQGYWASHFKFDPARVAVWREVARIIQRDIPPGSRVLDLGAGYCYFINNIEAGARHALDRDPGIAEYAAPGVVPHVGECTELSMFQDASLDVVFASNLFEHLTRDEFEATVVEVHRVVRPGGRLIIVQPNYRYCAREYFDDYTHRTVFTDWSLSHWLEARGFVVKTMLPRFIPGDFRSSRPKWPWLVRLYLHLPTRFRPLAQQMYCVAVRGEAESPSL